ncbi:MAG: hypothetical protein M3Y87_29125, partial [Myxococcota bacterium]|nr:hypothetical protein [Myxococcota bacterium]
MRNSSELRWDAPGPGPWELEGAHFPRPLARFGAAGFLRAFSKGFAKGTERYGLLLSHFDAELVNGFWYQQPAAFGAPKGAKGPPPAPILWLLTRLHPATRARIATCARAFETKLWREDLRLWDEVDKPAALARHRALLASDPALLDDAALAAHLIEIDQHAADMVVLHHRYSLPAILPVGDLIAHVSQWTGEPPGKILAMLRGTTPISNGILAAELDELVGALRESDDARAALDGSDAAATIVALSARQDAVGAAARAFFEGVRHRAVSYDVSAKCAGEMPEMLVATVRAAVRKTTGVGKDESADRIAAMRERVPAEHRARFDELVGEARVVNRLRDERGIYADGFAVGIMRRGVLEAGRRLAARGALHEVEHAVDLTTEEAVALLRGEPGPSADEVREHVEWRCTK